MTSGISLANKCILLFGVAVVVILTAALAVPWIRTQTMVRQSQLEAARQLADAWLAQRIQLGASGQRVPYPRSLITTDEAPADGESVERANLHLTLLPIARAEAIQDRSPFIKAALRRFRNDAQAGEHFFVDSSQPRRVYRYARALRQSDEASLPDGVSLDLSAPARNRNAADPLRAILIVDRTSDFAESQILLNRVFIITAGLVGSLLAIGVFYFILTKLILSPVRRLRETSERVEKGEWSTRSSIQTGDEFEQLSEAFNAMLDKVEQTQAKLRSMNESLDLKVNELAEANVGLYESNRLKSEFLANVSHELKTPLNSIIGFAELLEEQTRSNGEVDARRGRYLSNIIASSRSLLEMINELLDMAKIEAGRMEVNIESTSIADLVEGLVGIMGPQADAKQIDLQVNVPDNIPVIETDPGKLQQILYNFLSNAIKFTPTGGRVTLAAERIRRQDNSIGVRLSVTDTGPGIPEDMQDVIFEKFRQIDASHTREHPGTGLGLAICRELAEMLGASVSFTSRPDHGATFYVELPQVLQPEQPQPLMA